jgi:hypothetical protein
MDPQDSCPTGTVFSRILIVLGGVSEQRIARLLCQCNIIHLVGVGGVSLEYFLEINNAQASTLNKVWGWQGPG